MANNTDLVKEIGDAIIKMQERLNSRLLRRHEVVDIIDTLQRARDALRWIPCEERLPVESRLYWVTVLRPIPVNGKRLHVTQRYFDVLRGAFIIGEDKVLAWLEWPARYTPEEK